MKQNLYLIRNLFSYLIRLISNIIYLFLLLYIYIYFKKKINFFFIILLLFSYNLIVQRPDSPPKI